MTLRDVQGKVGGSQLQFNTISIKLWRLSTSYTALPSPMFLIRNTTVSLTSTTMNDWRLKTNCDLTKSLSELTWTVDLIAWLDGAIVATFVTLIFRNNLGALSGKHTVNGSKMKNTGKSCWELGINFSVGYRAGRKVKWTSVQALRLSTGRTAYRGSRGIARTASVV